MGRLNYLAMKTDDQVAAELISSDFNELKIAAKKLVNDATRLGGLGFGTSFLKWVASFAAMLDLLGIQWIFPKPCRYMFNSVRSFNFSIITFQQSYDDMLLLLSIFLANIKTMGLSADWLEMPGSLILLLVVAPSFFAHTLKDSWVGVVICLLIGCYLLQEHIRASGGFRNSFTQGHGISNTLGIVLLLVYPVWALVLHLI
ncbi:Cold-regulated 413 plasma membrane protein 2 [Citrus sinensis]|uniref:Cold-regulated 413 plasma membrane protein 2 n=1 Tax=Citrus sinensis TaxID=2711 RepID=A0ACB8J242_CITSI|nr:Cold-regulated 413 plasma membrane protein 2 [Citrus sinensis]